MRNDYIPVAVALRELNCTSLDSISDRILLQKKIYLLQDVGLPLGFSYNWYIHGPYSPDLTSAVYRIIPEGFESVEDKNFKTEYKEMVDKVNKLETNSSYARDLGVSSWYELLASISYWYKKGIINKDKLTLRVNELKPQFSSDNINAGIEAYSIFKGIEIS